MKPKDDRNALLSEAFQLFDDDKDGLIDINSLRSIILSFGFRVTREEVIRVAKGREEINYTHFCDIMSSKEVSHLKSINIQ